MVETCVVFCPNNHIMQDDHSRCRTCGWTMAARTVRSAVAGLDGFHACTAGISDSHASSKLAHWHILFGLWMTATLARTSLPELPPARD